MNRLYYSEQQEEAGGCNLVLVNGVWVPYTEWKCDEYADDPSAFDDAILVYEGEEIPKIQIIDCEIDYPFEDAI